MRGRTAAVLASTTLLIFLCFLFIVRSSTSLPLSLSRQYPYISSNTPSWHPPITKGLSDDDPGAGMIVKVRLEHEDVSWIDELFPVWRKQIVTISKKFASLHQGGMRVNRGRVADAYLTYIIENYDMLSDTVVFLPPDQPTRPGSRIASDNIRISMPSLQTPFVQDVGFTPLICPSKSACANFVHPFRLPPSSLRTQEVPMSQAWHGIFGDIPVLEDLASPLTAEFAVSRAQIRKRSPEEYLRMWTWLNTTEMDDDSAGAVFEHVWSVVFGREVEGCMDETQCECEIWGC